MVADGTGAGWDVESPITATGHTAVGAQEIRDLRLGTELRVIKEHVHWVTGSIASDSLDATGGGEHLEGSARIHTSTSAPTNMVVGAKDTAGNAANQTISGNEALAEGMMWTDTDGEYVCQVYVASAWHSLGYTKRLNDTISISGTEKWLRVNSSSSNPALEIVESGTGGVCLRLENPTPGLALEIVITGAGIGINIDHDRDGSSDIVLINVDGKNTSGAGDIVGKKIYVQTDTGDAIVFSVDASNTGGTGTEILFDFSAGAAGELCGHTKTGNLAVIPNSKGTFTIQGYIQIKDDGGTLRYIPYGDIVDA